MAKLPNGFKENGMNLHMSYDMYMLVGRIYGTAMECANALNDKRAFNEFDEMRIWIDNSMNEQFPDHAECKAEALAEMEATNNIIN